MALLGFPRIAARVSSPDQVFQFVKNDSTVTLTTGRAVVYDYGSVTNTATTGTFNNGFNVRLPVTAAPLDNPVAFAGIVVGGDIAANGGVGTIQVWGHCDRVMVTGSTAVNLGGGAAFTAAAPDATSFSNLILKPYDCFVAAGTTPGGLAACTYVSTGAAATTLVPCYVPGGFAQVAQLISGVSVNAGTTGTAHVKAFLRCL